MNYEIGDIVKINGLEGTVTGYGKYGGLFVRVGDSHYSKLYDEVADDIVFIGHAYRERSSCCGCC